MEPTKSESHLPGVVRYGAVIFAFVIFGIMPLYWASLRSVPSKIILLHRAIWVFLGLFPYIIFRSDFYKLYYLIKKNWHYLLISSGALGANWFGYIYAINHGFVIEAGLAYYIAPILSIALSLFFLKETVGKRQMGALFLVLFAIVFLLISKGVIPKFSLLIGISFALYGVLSRVMVFPAVERLALESLVIFIVFGILVQNPIESYKQFCGYPWNIQALLIGTGVTTIVSFGLYIASVSLVKFATVGILGFILPTIIFALGLYYFHEPLDKHTLIALVIIWTGIAIYISALCKPSKKGKIKD